MILDVTKPKSMAEYNAEIHRPKGIGPSKSLYLRFLKSLGVQSIIDIGSGSTEFLKAAIASRKVALDGGDRWEGAFKELGIEFFKLDFDYDDFPDITGLDAAVCSDVFEHLIYPDRTLMAIREMLSEEGVLFSHVPNEFSYKKTFKVMLGLSDSLYFHSHCEEYNDPHLHRFTKIGFEKFLRIAFQYNLYISDMRYGSKARFLQKIGIPVPYALQKGPTFISTNDRRQFLKLKEIKKMLKKKPQE